jgi:hypothetical protein
MFPPNVRSGVKSTTSSGTTCSKSRATFRKKCWPCYESSVTTARGSKWTNATMFGRRLPPLSPRPFRNAWIYRIRSDCRGVVLSSCIRDRWELRTCGCRSGERIYRLPIMHLQNNAEDKTIRSASDRVRRRFGRGSCSARIGLRLGLSR